MRGAMPTARTGASAEYRPWRPSALAQPAAIAQGLASARRQSVIWLSFQECTGCTESLTRSDSPSVENLIFDAISLDYHHTLQAASGEAARDKAERRSKGRTMVVMGRMDRAQRVPMYWSSW